jgi:hypothetical protein
MEKYKVSGNEKKMEALFRIGFMGLSASMRRCEKPVTAGA